MALSSSVVSVSPSPEAVVCRSIDADHFKSHIVIDNIENHRTGTHITDVADVQILFSRDLCPFLRHVTRDTRKGWEMFPVSSAVVVQPSVPTIHTFRK